MSLDAAESGSAFSINGQVGFLSSGLLASKKLIGLFGGGFAVLGAGSVWIALEAIDSGANLWLTILTGYLVLLGTAAFALQMWTLSKAVRQVVVPQGMVRSGSSSAWKLVNTLAISDASRLWCDLEPGTPATHESMAWARAMLDAIKEGQLSIVTKSGVGQTTVDRERENPHYLTQVSRSALKAWAQSKAQNPVFLRD